MIAVAIQKGQAVYAYDEAGRYLFSVMGTLQGFTSISLSVKRGNMITVYNEKGQYVRSF